MATRCITWLGRLKNGSTCILTKPIQLEAKVMIVTRFSLGRKTRFLTHCLVLADLTWERFWPRKKLINYNQVWKIWTHDDFGTLEIPPLRHKRTGSPAFPPPAHPNTKNNNSKISVRPQSNSVALACYTKQYCLLQKLLFVPMVDILKQVCSPQISFANRKSAKKI